ncbi:hypothetical protein [Streptomyces virginiae]|uniref:hypothetical protein n=1 Tax=Streptomyces virginiae TaxID=1961 RepID=UPI0036886317
MSCATAATSGISSYASSSLARPRCSGRLTYQTEWVDPQDHTGWTVTVSGPAQRITNGYQQARYRLMLHAGPQTSHEHLLRIRPENVTGYRLTRAPA